MQIRMAATIAAAILAIQPVGLYAQRVEFTGEAAFETRFFPRPPLYDDQSGARLSPSFMLEPEFIYESADGVWRVSAIGFGRIDAHDSHRTHVDLRELGVLYLGTGVIVFAGVGKVYWGVTEVNHLIDIVNQTDAVEDVDTEDKLGQPMVSVTLEGSWGFIDLFYLPMFRERTFPADDARLRGPLPISTDETFSSSAGRFHQDFAIRWKRPFNAFDVGVAFFRGTSREARFEVVTNTDGVSTLRPRYDVIDQLGLDLQWTGVAALLKLEAMTRGGHGDRFVAVAGGIEYTLYQILSGNSDLGLLAEFMLDGRDDTAPATVCDNDLFIGFRWALNDVDDTSILGGPVIDYQSGEVLALLELERRVGSQWRVQLEARLFANTALDGPTNGLRRDGFVTFRLSRFF